MAMRTKKRIEINSFDNFSNYSKPTNEGFFNYKVTEKLQASNGVNRPLFPYSATYDRQYSLALTTGGFNKVEGITSFKQYFPESETTTHRLLIYGDDKKVYINQLLNNSGQIFWLYSLTFDSPPTVLPYKKDGIDVMILADNKKMVFWETNKSPFEVGNLPIISSICMDDGYIYCTLQENPSKIWYTKSSDLQFVGVTDVGSGYIMLDSELGDARKVILFNKEVYIIRDYGISKVTNIKGDISINNVYTSNTLIYCNTVAVSSNIVFFMTKEGLYTFNGYNVSKTKLDLNELSISSKNAVGAVLGDTYYLAFRLDFNDEKQILCEQGEYVNNALAIIDVNEFSYQLIRGVDIKNFLPLKTEVFEKMLVVFNSGNNGIGEIIKESIFFDKALPKFWKSGELFTTSEAKLFTKLTVNADEGVKITLLYDGKELSFTTYTAGMNEFVFKICAKQLRIEISSNQANANVNNIGLDYYVY